MQARQKDKESIMKATKTLYVTNREEWRKWLEKKHNTEKEVWLIYYKKHTGKPRIPYDDAVVEALCFGWVDSIVKRVDNESKIMSHVKIKRVRI